MKKPTSFSMSPELMEGLRRQAYRLSAKEGKRITPSMIVEKALLKYGVKPCTEQSK